MIPPRIRHLLLDFDGVLSHYSHETRIAHLARHAGAEHERVREVLFGSGLETEYDGGQTSTDAYLSRLGDGIGAAVDAETWIASRMAGNQADALVLESLLALDAGIGFGVLTNNGELMVQAIPRIVAPLAARLQDRVLTSGSLRLRKPDPAIFRLALETLGWQTQETLFVDDKFVNVQGARAAGLHAETSIDARTFRKLLKRYRLS